VYEYLKTFFVKIIFPCLSPTGTLLKNLGHRPKLTNDVPLGQNLWYF
jgi:hypothetical protein